MNKLAFTAAATAALGGAAVRPPRRNAALQRVMGLMRRWRERAHSHRGLCELNDHTLQDIGLTRDALLREAPRPFWRRQFTSLSRSGSQ
ncbi:MAG: DUF1127 domain-containing protein [Stellaceae bacterium]